MSGAMKVRRKGSSSDWRGERGEEGGRKGWRGGEKRGERRGERRGGGREDGGGNTNIHDTIKP